MSFRHDPLIAQLVERRTVVACNLVILRSVVRLRLTGYFLVNPHKTFFHKIQYSFISFEK